MDVDAIIAEAVNAQGQETETASKEAQVTQQEVQDNTPETEDISSKPDSELTPEQLAKRERNRESHLKSKLAKITRENRELQQRIAQQQQPPQKPQITTERDLSKKPDPNDQYYKDKTWAEYNEDLTEWKLEQKFAENTKKAEESKWIDERGDLIDKRITELQSSIPDFGQVFENIEDLAKRLTPEQARIALEADDINLAVYTLQKEGRIDEVLKLPVTKLAMEIAKAEMRGQQYLKQSNITTKAPAPINAAKGNSSASSKSIESMSVSELMNWQKKKG